MIRPLIPGAECDNVGGLPPVACDPIPAVAYEVPLTGQWNPGGAGETPTPVLVVGAQVADLDPEPPGPVVAELAFSVVTGVPPALPEDSDVPQEDAWQVLFSTGETEFLGFVLPVPIIGTFVTLGTPIWFRIRTTDALGCTTTAYLYFPEGIPEHADDVPLVLFAGGEQFEITVEAAPADDEEGPLAEEAITVTPECPPARRAVAVAPACEFPVQIDAPVEIDGPVEITTPEGEPLPVAVEVPEGETLPVTVEVPEGETIPVSFAFPAPVGLTATPVTELEGPSGAGLQTQAIPDGWLKIIVYGAGDTAGQVRLALWGGGAAIPASNNGDGTYGPLVIDAPFGYAFGGFDLQARSTGPGSVYANAIPFYPPAP